MTENDEVEEFLVLMFENVRVRMTPVGEGYWQFDTDGDGVLEVTWQIKNLESKS